MKLEAVIFDMDGLMIDSEKVTYEGYVNILSQYGLTMEEEFYKSFIGWRDRDIRELLKRKYKGAVDVDELVAAVHLYINDYFETRGVPVKEGLVELLVFLKEQKIKTILATGSVRYRVDHILELAGLTKYFDASVCGDEVTKGKPDPEGFLRACEKAGVAPGKALVLEDSEAGIEAACRGNIKVIGVPDMVEPSDKYVGMAYAVKGSLTDVLGLLKKNDLNL